jgi:myosin heavy subunit
MKYPTLRQLKIAGFTAILTLTIAGCGNDDLYQEFNHERSQKLETLDSQIAAQEHKLSTVNQELNQKQVEFTYKTAEAKILEEDINAMVAEQAEAKRQTEEAILNAETTTAELAELQAQHADISQQLAEAENSKAQLEADEARLAEIQQEYDILQARIDEHPELSDIVSSLEARKAELKSQVSIIAPIQDDGTIIEYEYAGKVGVSIDTTFERIDFHRYGVDSVKFSELSEQALNNINNGISFIDPVLVQLTREYNLYRMIDYNLDVVIRFSMSDYGDFMEVKPFSTLDDDVQVEIEEMRPIIEPDAEPEPEITEADTTNTNVVEATEVDSDANTITGGDIFFTFLFIFMIALFFMLII